MPVDKECRNNNSVHDRNRESVNLVKKSLALDATACDAYTTVLRVQLVCLETLVAALCSTVAASSDAAVKTEAAMCGRDDEVVLALVPPLASNDWLGPPVRLLLLEWELLL